MDEAYRKEHKLLSPEEIKEIREQYGLSQRGLARVLAWGDKTIHRYEKGAVQDKAHNGLLLLMKDPQNMKQYLLECETNVPEKQVQRVLRHIELLEKTVTREQGRRIMRRAQGGEASEANGMKRFDPEKFAAAAVYVAAHADRAQRIRFYGLLFYVDMLHYSRKGTSLTGTCYQRAAEGVAPKNADILMGALQTQSLIQIDAEFVNDVEVYPVKAAAKIPEGLEADETALIDEVLQALRDSSSFDIASAIRKDSALAHLLPGDEISYVEVSKSGEVVKLIDP